MNQLIQHLKKRKHYLENLQKHITQKSANFPDGSLRISINNGFPRYYHVTTQTNRNGKYIGRKNISLASQLSTKSYYQQLNKKIGQELHLLNQYLTTHQENSLEDIYTNLNPHHRELISPLIVPDNIYIENWENESYEPNPYYPENKIYSTRKDELVRSKSEVILADMYTDLGIPYRYEAPLYLDNGQVKYPDFTLLNIETREIIYHEHLGLLDDEAYFRNNLYKLQEYLSTGIYPGKNLIITYEAEGLPLNIKQVRNMITEIFHII